MSTQIAYSFDSAVGATVPDQSGYLADLTTTGGVSAAGHTAGGMRCNNGGGTGVLPDYQHQAALGGAGSYMMWAKPDGAGTSQVLWAIGTGSTGDVIVLYAADPSGHVAYYANGVLHTTTVSIMDGGWHHVSVQTQGDLSSGGLVIKVDDTIVYQGAPLTTQNLNAAAFSIGQLSDGSMRFQGVIDDFRALNDPIDSATLGTSNADFMATPVRSLLDAEYSLDETSGTTAHDTSGKDHALILTSGSLWTAGKHAGGLNIGGGATTPVGNAQITAGESPRWTLMCWYKTPATAGNSGAVWTIVEVRDTAGNLRAEILTADGSSISLYPRVYDQDHNQWFGQSYNNSIPADGDWHHLAVAIYPTGVDAYVDGVEVGGQSGLPSIDFPDWDVLNVGAGRFTGPPTGAVDDVRVISNYLYDDAIGRQLAAASTAPPTKINSLWVGDRQPSAIYVGSQPVTAIYVGSTLVYG